MKKLSMSLLSLLICVGCASKPEQFLYEQKPAFYAYMIGDIDKAHIDTTQNEKAYITPASCQKTITALLAYKTLGDDYRYHTTLSVTKQAEKIQDVILTFSGDPSLTSENLAHLLSPLQGVEITGKIILDASSFQTQPYPNSIMKDDIGTDYSQPVSALIIDENLITVSIQSEPNTETVILKNDMGYLMNADVSISSEPSLLRFMWQDKTIHVTGNLNREKAFFEKQISPEHIDVYMIEKVKKILTDLSIFSEVSVIHNNSQRPTQTVLLNSWHSEPLSSILPPALKQSNNLVFDSLYLTILQSQSPITIQHWEDGDRVIKALLKKHFDIELEEALIIDGSGLSRYNRLQVRQLFELLKKGYAIKAFVNALPVPGEIETSLEKRTILPKNIHAKTGSMSGISCLCGYQIDNHSNKVFVIVANSFSPPLSNMYIVQDRFLRRHLGNE